MALAEVIVKLHRANEYSLTKLSFSGEKYPVTFVNVGEVVLNFARQAFVPVLARQLSQPHRWSRPCPLESSFILSHSTERWLVLLLLLEHKVSSALHCEFNYPRTS